MKCIDFYLQINVLNQTDKTISLNLNLNVGPIWTRKCIDCDTMRNVNVNWNAKWEMSPSSMTMQWAPALPRLSAFSCLETVMLCCPPFARLPYTAWRFGAGAFDCELWLRNIDERSTALVASHWRLSSEYSVCFLRLRFFWFDFVSFSVLLLSSRVLLVFFGVLLMSFYWLLVSFQCPLMSFWCLLVSFRVLSMSFVVHTVCSTSSQIAQSHINK